LDLATSPLRLTTSNFFQLNTGGHSLYVTFYLTRGWFCHFQLLLGLASAVIFRSESHGTHDHILLSQIRDTPNLEGQVPVFISPLFRGDLVIPPGTGFPFRRLLRLAGLRWKYSNPPPHGLTNSTPLVLLITYRHVPCRKHSSHYCCIQSFPWTHTRLWSRYLVTAVLQLFVSRSLPSNKPTRHIINTF
jgi:hypothetical protein